jgi:hypothetical protein
VILCTLEPYLDFADTVSLASSELTYDILLRRPVRYEYSCLKDSYICFDSRSPESGDTNYGSLSNLFADSYHGDYHVEKRVYMAFGTPAPDLPNGARIDSVTVYLKAESARSSVIINVVAGDWEENAITWGTQPGLGDLIHEFEDLAEDSWLRWAFEDISSLNGMRGICIRVPSYGSGNLGNCYFSSESLSPPKLVVVASY